MFESTRGLVLRIRPLTETSLIVHWLTPELGRLATVAKGARRPKSPFRGKLDVFYVADLSFSRSRTSELHNLREVNLRHTHPFLRENLGYLQQAAYCVRLIEQATETETPLGPMFDLINDFIQTLPAQACRAEMVLAFEVRFLTELGLSPDIARSELSAASKTSIGRLEQTAWPHLPRLVLELQQRKEISHFLQRFMMMNLGRLPKGRETALEPELTRTR